MKKILLVEDEQIVRLALKTLVDWYAHGFEIAYEGRHGKQALRLLQEHPDIDMMITDINMPVMDGLTLIEEAMKLPKPPISIVLSAYDDYNLVRQAFRLGAYDYILKTQMVPEEVVKILQKSLGEQPDMESAKYLAYERQVFLRGVMEGNITESIAEQMKRFQLQHLEGHFIISYIWVDNYLRIKERYENNTLKTFSQGVIGTIRQILDREGNGEITGVTFDGYALILSYKHLSHMAIREGIEGVIGKIRSALKQYMNIHVSIGISSVVTELEQLSKAYMEAKSYAKKRYILGKGRNIYPEDVTYMLRPDMTKTNIDKEPLIHAILQGGKKELQYSLKNLSKAITSYGVDLEVIQGLYMETIYMVIYTLNEKNMGHLPILEHNTNFYTLIRAFDTQREIDEWIGNLMTNIQDYLTQQSIETNQGIVNKALSYMDENYMHHLSLGDVSAYLELSEGYLSKLFSTTTGKSFITHLTDMRIKHAKICLSKTNMKIYEVSEAVGYDHVEHFSRVFKKHVGESPKKYQKRKG